MKFKTLIVKLTGEFAAIEVSMFDGICLYTRETPVLYPMNMTIKKLAKRYKGFALDNDLVLDEPFDWDIHIGDRWELIECELNINNKI